MGFREYINENITPVNFKELEKFMKKQPGFKSFKIQDDQIIIEFKSNKNAIDAMKKSQASNTEIGAFGDATAANKVITVDLNQTALDALN